MSFFPGTFLSLLLLLLCLQAQVVGPSVEDPAEINPAPGGGDDMSGGIDGLQLRCDSRSLLLGQEIHLEQPPRYRAATRNKPAAQGKESIHQHKGKKASTSTRERNICAANLQHTELPQNFSPLKAVITKPPQVASLTHHDGLK
jgi:hypothetical protein